MIIYVDMDDTICSLQKKMDYSTAVPLYSRISKINALYDDGHRIVYWTARGTISGIDWAKLTKKQFKEWGVKYHELLFKKPAYDLFIDDKNINSNDFFSG